MHSIFFFFYISRYILQSQHEIKIVFFGIMQFIVNVLQVHIIIITVLLILTQNQFLLQLLVSDDVGGAVTCHSHEISQ